MVFEAELEGDVKKYDLFPHSASATAVVADFHTVSEKPAQLYGAFENSYL